MTRSRSYAELVVATAIWGFGFLASTWALESIGPVWQTGLRFGIAAVLLFLVTRIFPRTAFPFRWRDFHLVAIPGICMFGLITFQTWGLRYTTPTRCGFITVLYVVFVPMMEYAFFRVGVRWLLGVWIALALVGVALVCGVVGAEGVGGATEFFSAFNRGDVFCLVCAIFAAGHILASSRSAIPGGTPLQFHLYQCLWVAGLGILAGIFFEGFAWISVPFNPRAYLGLALVGVFSTTIAFLIQVRVQWIIPPATLSLLLLLESLWAMGFSAAFGGEALTVAQLLGGALILFSAAAETLSVASPRHSISN